MTTAVLRVSGAEVDLDSCLGWLPGAAVQATWRVGESRFGGRVNETSGFSVLLSEGSESRSVVQTAFLAFRAMAPHVAELVREGAEAVLDFGLYVGANAGTSIDFDVTILRSAERAGISITVSAYPCSD